jgi:hypothetical protein
LYTSCVLGLRPSALFIEFYYLKKKKNLYYHNTLSARIRVTIAFCNIIEPQKT